MSQTDKLRAALEGHGDADFLTVQQRRKVQKQLARHTVAVDVPFSGGEFLELEDWAKVEGYDDLGRFVQAIVRAHWLSHHPNPLGFRYEIFDDTMGQPPKLGAALKKTLGLAKPRP